MPGELRWLAELVLALLLLFIGGITGLAVSTLRRQIEALDEKMDDVLGELRKINGRVVALETEAVERRERQRELRTDVDQMRERVTTLHLEVMRRRRSGL